MKAAAEQLYTTIRQAYDHAIPEIEAVYQGAIARLVAEVAEMRDSSLLDLSERQDKVDKVLQTLQNELTDLYFQTYYPLIKEYIQTYMRLLPTMQIKKVPMSTDDWFTEQDLHINLLDFRFYLTSITSSLRQNLYDTLLLAIANRRDALDVIGQAVELLRKGVYQGRMKNLFYLSLIKHCNGTIQLMHIAIGLDYEQVFDLDEGLTHGLKRRVPHDKAQAPDLFGVHALGADAAKMVWHQQKKGSSFYHGLVPPSRFGSKELIVPAGGDPLR